MYDRIEIFQMAFGLAGHAAGRQAKIAANVANADTPGYRAQDLAPFSETYRMTDADFGLKTTRGSHSVGLGGLETQFKTVDRAGPSDPNGNTVSIEEEALHAIEARRAHDRALTVYQTSMNILRTSLGRGR